MEHVKQVGQLSPGRLHYPGARVGRLLIRRLGSHSMARLGRRLASDDPGCPGFSPRGLTSCQMAQVRLLRRGYQSTFKLLLMFEWSNLCSTIALAALSSFRSACPMFHRLTSVACPIFEWLLPREMRRARGQFAFPQFPHLYICFHSLHTCAQPSHCTLYTNCGPCAANSHAHVHNRPKPQRVFSF